MKKHNALLAAGILSVLMLSACQQSPVAQKGTVNEPVAKSNKLMPDTCDVITPDDLALITKMPADKLKTIITPIKDGEWTCTYGENAAVSFTVTISKNREEAEKDMDEYRKSLEVASKSIPEGEYPQGAYSDISNTGEDAIYSYVNNTLKARENAVSILVMNPKDKLQKINIAAAFFYTIRQK